jgi:hypothetical protein
VLDEIIRGYDCGFECSRPVTDYIPCILKVLNNKQEYSAAIHQLFMDFKQAYDPCRQGACVLYSQCVWYDCETSLVN